MSVIRIVTYGLILTGVVLLALSIALGGQVNFALPVVFLALGGIFLALGRYLGTEQRWAALLYVPGAVFAALGLVFLLNVATADWNAWAYAWMLPLAAAGAGLLLAGLTFRWPRVLRQCAWGLLLGGLSGFVIFGAITGGLFIQISAPLLLIGAGGVLWLARRNPDLAQRLRVEPGDGLPDGAGIPHAEAGELAEPVSARELDVLRLLSDGLSNQEIALRLKIAPSTVKTHINNLYTKIGAQNRVQAVRRARELGLL